MEILLAQILHFGVDIVVDTQQGSFNRRTLRLTVGCMEYVVCSTETRDQVKVNT